jgi:hypothetical protein
VGVGHDVYRLGCGPTRTGEGPREGPDDLKYQMDFLCA